MPKIKKRDKGYLAATDAVLLWIYVYIGYKGSEYKTSYRTSASACTRIFPWRKGILRVRSTAIPIKPSRYI